MSELPPRTATPAEERAAKAARAKEKLKKFQAAKSSKAKSDAGSSRPGSPNSVASTPAPPVPPIPRQAAPPAPISVPSHPSAPEPPSIQPEPPASPPHSNSTGVVVSPPQPSSPIAQDASAEDRGLIQAQQQTIALLVADKNGLVSRVKELEQEVVSEKLREGDGEGRERRIKGEKEALAAELTELGMKYATLERDSTLSKSNLSDVRQQLKARDAKLEALSAQLSEAHSSNTQVMDLEAKLQRKSSRADELDVELSRLKSSFGDVQATLQARNRELAAAKAASEVNESDKQLIARGVGDAKGIIQTMKSEIDSLRREKQDLSKTVLAAQLAANNSQSSLPGLQNALKEARTAATQAHMAKDGVVAQLSELQRRCATLEQELSATRGGQEGLDGTLSQLRSEIELRDAKAKDEAMRAELRFDERETKFRAEKEGLVAQLIQTKEEREIAKERYGEVEQARVALMGELENVKASHAGLESQIAAAGSSSAAEEAVAAIREELELVNQSKDRLDQDLEEAMASLDASGRRERDLQRALDEAEGELDVASARVVELEEAAVTSGGADDALHSELAKVIEERDAYSGRLASLDNQLTEALDDSASAAAVAQQEIDEAQVSLAQATNELASSRESQSALKSTLAQLSAKVDSLQSSLDASTAELAAVTLRSQELQIALTDSKAALASSDSRAMSFQSSLEDVEKELDVQTGKYASAQAALEAAELRLGESSSTYDGALREKLELTSRVSQLERQLEETADRHATSSSASKSELDGLRASLTRASEDLVTASQTKKELDARVLQLSNRSATLEAELSAAQSELASSQSGAGTTEQALASAQKDLARVSAAHDALEMINVSLSTSLEELRASITTLSDSHSSSADRAAALSLALQQKEQAGDQLQKELEDLRAQVTAADNARLESDEGWASSRGAEEASKQKLSATVQELSNARTELAKVERTMKASHDEVTSLQLARTELDTKVNQLESSLQALSLDVQSLTSDKAYAEEQIVVLQRSIKEKEAVIAESEAAAARETERTSALLREHTSVATSANRRASKTERELKAMMASGNERNDQAGQLHDAIARLESEVARLRSVGDGAATEIANLTRELERNVAEVGLLQEDLEEQRQVCEEADQALNDVQEAFARAQEDLDAKDVEIEELKSRPSPQLDATPNLPSDAPADSEEPYDRDYVDAIHQQYELDLSEARADIRKLQERVFAAEDANYKMSKTNGDLRSQVESMLESLQMERERTRRKNQELMVLREAATEGRQLPSFAVSPAPRPMPSIDPLLSSFVDEATLDAPTASRSDAGIGESVAAGGDETSSPKEVVRDEVDAIAPPTLSLGATQSVNDSRQCLPDPADHRAPSPPAIHLDSDAEVLATDRSVGDLHAQVSPAEGHVSFSPQVAEFASEEAAHERHEAVLDGSHELGHALADLEAGTTSMGEYDANFEAIDEETPRPEERRDGHSGPQDHFRDSDVDVMTVPGSHPQEPHPHPHSHDTHSHDYHTHDSLSLDATSHHDHSHNDHSHHDHSHHEHRDVDQSQDDHADHQPPHRVHEQHDHSSNGNVQVDSPPVVSALAPPPPSTPSRTSPRAYAHRRLGSSLASVPEAGLRESSNRSLSATSAPRSPSTTASNPATPQSISRAARHARRESLSALKTRLEDELGVDDLEETLLSPSKTGARILSPGAERRSRTAVLGDDLVWCAQCAGDLYVV